MLLEEATDGPPRAGDSAMWLLASTACREHSAPVRRRQWPYDRLDGATTMSRRLVRDPEGRLQPHARQRGGQRPARPRRRWARRSRRRSTRLTRTSRSAALAWPRRRRSSLTSSTSCACSALGRRRWRHAVPAAGHRRRPVGPDRDQNVRLTGDLRALRAHTLTRTDTSNGALTRSAGVCRKRIPLRDSAPALPRMRASPGVPARRSFGTRAGCRGDSRLIQAG